MLLAWQHLGLEAQDRPHSTVLCKVHFATRTPPCTRSMFSHTQALEISKVASFGSLFVAPPIGVALGATSAAAGVSSGAGDVVADAEP